MKKLEIERKFLLTRLPNVKKWDDMISIIQYYIEDSVRLRQSTSKLTNKSIYTQTIKEFVSPGINKEKEKRISEKKFWELLYATSYYTMIYKTRYIYESPDKRKWEIDVFTNRNLVIAEMELKSMKEKLRIPNCIKEKLLMEVTNYKEFSNYEISKR